MSALHRSVALVLALAMVATGCEESAFTTSRPPVTDDDPADEPTFDEPDDSEGNTESAPTGCAVDAFPGDQAFAEAVCQYQAVLIRALSAGIAVDSDITDRVAGAMVAWVTDPARARQQVVDAIAEIDVLIVAVPGVTTETVGDLADNLFACVSEAAKWLQVAFDRINFGGVAIPEMEDWQAAFDEAAELANSGNAGGAMALVCTLTEEMQSILIQD